MIICFLDCDGVLNNAKYFSGTKDDINSDNYEVQDVINKQLDPDNVKALNKIITVTKCNIVLSSSWRKFIQLDELCKGLVKNGMKKEFCKNFISKTPILGSRADEINEWLKTWKGETIDKWIVLDDTRDKNDNLKSFNENWIKINPNKGLTQKKADKAINFLIK